MNVTALLLIVIPIIVFIAGIACGYWLRNHILPSSARLKVKQPEQLSKISVLDSSLGSPNVTPESQQDSRIRARIDTHDGIQKSLGRSPLQNIRRTGSTELVDICRTASAISMFLEEAEQRPLINRLLSMPSIPRAPGLMDAQVLESGNLQVQMDEIDLEEQIGRGGFGAVYKGSWRGAQVAVKYIICDVADADAVDQSVREVVLSKKMSHPNVVQTYGFTMTGNSDLGMDDQSTNPELELLEKALSTGKEPAIPVLANCSIQPMAPVAFPARRVTDPESQCAQSKNANSSILLATRLPLRRSSFAPDVPLVTSLQTRAAMTMPQATAAKGTNGQRSSEMPMSPFSAVQGNLTRHSEPDSASAGPEARWHPLMPDGLRRSLSLSEAEMKLSPASTEAGPVPSSSPFETPDRLRSLVRQSDSFNQVDPSESLFDGTYSTPAADHAIPRQPSRLGAARPPSARNRAFRQLVLEGVLGGDGLAGSLPLPSFPESPLTATGPSVSDGQEQEGGLDQRRYGQQQQSQANEGEAVTEEARLLEGPVPVEASPPVSHTRMLDSSSAVLPSRGPPDIEDILDEGLTCSYASFNSDEGFGSPITQRHRDQQSARKAELANLEESQAFMVVIMEYCDLGSLLRAISKKAFKPHGKWSYATTYRACLRTVQEVAKGMEYIHSFDIVHGDLKPGNVLLKTHRIDRRGYIAKVSDFGLSRPLVGKDGLVQVGNAVGTISYTAPETFTENVLQKPSDVFAFGILMWEIFYCKSAYEGLLEVQICHMVIEQGLRPEFDDTCPLPYQELAQACWHQSPSSRPSFKELVNKLTEIEGEFRRECHRQRSAAGSQAASGTTTPLPRSRRSSLMGPHALLPLMSSGISPAPRHSNLSRLASSSGFDRLQRSSESIDIP
ncbi:hypothetical protein WJX74_001172 [Apatococcus lobatus]|uniref:Protein kinase domain-containing protein n=1 Tax=Apatococcus lobatus TaxID=904363 RepID=A0AAW1RIU9_9CHLO